MIKEGNNSFLTIGSTLPVNVNISGTRKSIFSMDVIKVRLIIYVDINVYVIGTILCVIRWIFSYEYLRGIIMGRSRSLLSFE